MLYRIPSLVLSMPYLLHEPEQDYHKSVHHLLRYASQCTHDMRDATISMYVNQLIDTKRSVPNLGHFIWIGDTSQLDTSYIRIWSQTNKRIDFCLWHHPGTEFCCNFHHILNNHVKKTGTNELAADLIKLQNEAFDFIYQRINSVAVLGAAI